MALFKLRKGGDEAAATARQPESIEAIRRRAKHRLIGAAVLVLVGVLGFPLLFDTQPRPIAVDIPIEIPDRNKVKPLPAPAPAPAVAQAPSAPPAAASTPPAAVVVQSKVAEPRAETKPEPRPEPKSEARAEPKAPPPAVADGAKAQALLEGKTAVEGRFVVQVGAFADVAKAREARMKVERAGLKTYTTVTETKEGRRVRVRAGPFTTRSEADKAADKIKGLDLPAAILAL